jgi:hypothetical protein
VHWTYFLWLVGYRLCSGIGVRFQQEYTFNDRELINELIDRKLFPENEKDALADFGREIKIE